jgi:hypothetical protein
MSIGAGAKIESTSKNASVSRVKFSLPIVLPTVGRFPEDGARGCVPK